MCEFRSLLDWGAFHSLCGGLALSWRWVPSRAVKNCWDFGALFGGHLLFAVGFLQQVSQLLSVHCSWACENAKMVAYARMTVPQEESFKFILHVRFIASSKVCSSESTLVGLRRFVTPLSRLQGSH